MNTSVGRRRLGKGEKIHCKHFVVHTTEWLHYDTRWNVNNSFWNWNRGLIRKILDLKSSQTIDSRSDHQTFPMMINLCSRITLHKRRTTDEKCTLKTACCLLINFVGIASFFLEPSFHIKKLQSKKLVKISERWGI
jgi:hypothetical protein